MTNETKKPEGNKSLVLPQSVEDNDDLFSLREQLGSVEKTVNSLLELKHNLFMTAVEKKSLDFYSDFKNQIELRIKVLESQSELEQKKRAIEALETAKKALTGLGSNFENYKDLVGMILAGLTNQDDSSAVDGAQDSTVEKKEEEEEISDELEGESSSDDFLPAEGDLNNLENDETRPTRVVLSDSTTEEKDSIGNQERVTMPDPESSTEKNIKRVKKIIKHKEAFIKKFNEYKYFQYLNKQFANFTRLSDLDTEQSAKLKEIIDEIRKELEKDKEEGTAPTVVSSLANDEPPITSEDTQLTEALPETAQSTTLTEPLLTGEDTGDLGSSYDQEAQDFAPKVKENLFKDNT